MRRVFERTFTATLVSALLVVIGAGCGDSRESLAKESVSAMKEMISILDTVKDEASAKAAKPDLQALVDKLNDINERGEKLGMPSEEEFKSIDEKFGKEMEDLQKKMIGNMMRIAFDPKIQSVLGDIDFKAMK